jgi:PEP-CTERM motif-containing protein
MLRKSWVSIGLVGALLAVPAVASATIYYPNGTAGGDLNDLDHHYLYTWRINDPSLTNKTVTAAKLVFKQLYNWDNTANMLFLYLLNNALVPTTMNNGGAVKDINGNNTACANANNCVSSFIDESLSQAPVNITDDFVSGRYNSSPSWPIFAGTAQMNLTQRSFAGQGKNPTIAPGQANPTGWSYVTDGATTCTGSNCTYQLYTYTYTFQADELAALNTYIVDGILALGLDPDCHFFNNGISLDLTTITNSQTVPEPGSLLLLGTGLALARRRYLRRRRS